MKSKKKQFAKDFLSYGLVESLGRIVSIFLLPILTRALSVEDYGFIDLIFAITLLLASTFELALNTALNRSLRVHRGERSPLYFTVFVFVFFFSVLISTPLLIYSDLISILLANDSRFSYFFQLSVLAAAFMALADLAQLILRRKRKIFQFGFLNIGYTVLYVSCSLFLVITLNYGVAGVFYGYLFSNLMKCLGGIFLTRHEFVIRIDLVSLKKALRYSLPFFPGSIAVWANSQLNRVLILKFLGAASLGFFGAAMRVSNLVNFLTQIFKKTWQPYSMELIQENEDRKIYAEVLVYYFIVYLSICVLFFLFSPYLIKLILPDEYFKVYLAIPWLIAGHVFHSAGSIVNIGSIIMEKTGVNSRAAILALIINVLSTIGLGYYFGITGVAIGYFLSQVASRLFLLVYTQKIVQIDYDILSVFKLTFVYLIAIASFSYYLEYHDFHYLNYSGFVSVFIPCYFLLAYSFAMRKYQKQFLFGAHVMMTRLRKKLR